MYSYIYTDINKKTNMHAKVYLSVIRLEQRQNVCFGFTKKMDIKN